MRSPALASTASGNAIEQDAQATTDTVDIAMALGIAGLLASGSLGLLGRIAGHRVRRLIRERERERERERAAR